MSTSRYRLLNYLLLAALFAGSAWAYPRLPARIPMHFDLAGQPDRWETRSLVSWFLLPAIALALALFMGWIGGVGARNPHTWNLPDKARFLALSARARAPIVERMQAFLAFVSVLVTALMCAIQVSIYQASTGSTTTLPGWMTIGIGLFLLVTVASALRLNASVGRMIRDASASPAD